MIRFLSFRLLILALVLGVLATGTGCSREMKAKRYASRAEKFRKEQQYQRAEIDYITAIQLGSTNASTIAGLGMAFYEQGKMPQAFSALKRALEIDPKNAAAHAKLGVITRSMGQVAEARQEAIKALDLEKGNTEALLLLADCSIKPEEIQETQRRLDAAPAELRDGIVGNLVRGSLKQKQKDPAGAEAEFQAAIKKDPKSEKPYVALAGVYLTATNIPAAEASLRKASELAPPRSPANIHLAMFLSGMGKTEEAKQVATRITEKAPDFLPAWTFLAQTALAEKQLDKCAEYVKRVQDLDPANYDGLVTKADLLMYQNKPADAIKQYDFIIQSYGTNANHLYKLGLALVANRQPNQAIAALDRAVAASSNHVEAVLLESNLLMNQGNNARAATMLRALINRAMTLNRQGQARLPQVFALLARAQINQNNAAEAASTYEAMRKIFPNLLEVHLEAAMGLADLKRTDEAKVAYKQYVNATTNTVGLVMAGNGLANLKDMEGARAAYDKAVGIQPDYMPALEGLVRLDSAEGKFDQAIARAQKKADEGKGGGIPYLLIGHTHVQNAINTARTVLGRTNAPDAELMKVPQAQGEISKAEAALKKSVEVEPLLTPAHQELAVLYVALGRQQQAITELRGLLSKTNVPSACLQLALIETQQGDQKAAAESYEKLLQVQPNSIEGLNNLAGIYLDYLNQMDRGAELARKARQLAPGVPAVADTLGWALTKQGDYAQAIPLLREASAALPQEPEVNYHLGMAYYATGQDQAALFNLQKAAAAEKDFVGKKEVAESLKILGINPEKADAQAKAALEERLKAKPSDVIAQGKMASVLEKDGSFDRAAALYEEILRNAPGNAQVSAKLARLYAGPLNAPDKVLEVARVARSNNADNPELAHIVGGLQWKRGNWNAAVNAYEESARNAPDDPDIAFDLAWAYYSVGRVGNALEAMRTAAAANNYTNAAQAKTFIELVTAADQPGKDVQASMDAALKADSEYVPALFLQAVLDEGKKDYKGAAQLYGRVLKRFPEFTPAIRQLAILDFEQLKQDQEAFELATKVRAIQPNDPQVTRILGILAFRKGDFTRATQFLTEASPAYQQDAQLFFHLGMAQKALKRKLESRQSLEKAIGLKLSEPQLKEAQQALVELKG